MKRDDKGSIPEWEEIAATSMQFKTCGFLVHLEILGVTGAPQLCKKLKKNFRSKKNEKCLGFFYLGKFPHKNLKKTRRDNIENKISWF